MMGQPSGPGACGKELGLGPIGTFQVERGRQDLTCFNMNLWFLCGK